MEIFEILGIKAKHTLLKLFNKEEEDENGDITISDDDALHSISEENKMINMKKLLVINEMRMIRNTRIKKIETVLVMMIFLKK